MKQATVQKWEAVSDDIIARGITVTAAAKERGCTSAKTLIQCLNQARRHGARIPTITTTNGVSRFDAPAKVSSAPAPATPKVKPTMAEVRAALTSSFTLDQAADALGIGARTIHRILKSHGLAAKGLLKTRTYTENIRRGRVRARKDHVEPTFTAGVPYLANLYSMPVAQIETARKLLGLPMIMTDNQLDGLIKWVQLSDWLDAPSGQSSPAQSIGSSDGPSTISTESAHGSGSHSTNSSP